MKKTYITTMPDHVGAFLKACRLFAVLDANITRVSYSKAVDTHTLFIEAEGTEESLNKATKALEAIGYLPAIRPDKTVLLAEFRLKDEPGTVMEVLKLIQSYAFNISYISSQADGSGYQRFKMGLMIEDHEKATAFLEDANRLCPVRVLEYDKLERNFDNSIFYLSFANEMSETMGLTESERTELVIQSNLVMQLLDEQGGSPSKTFTYIGKFGETLARYKGDYFAPRITCQRLTADVTVTLIEPPCGSNTTILRYENRLLFIDSGYYCYKEEMQELLHTIYPDFDILERELLLTHADVDHCGLMELFDKVWVSEKSRYSFLAEQTPEGGYRERNAYHAPYIRICKLLTQYRPAAPERFQSLGGDLEPLSEPFAKIGVFSFGSLTFDVWEGAGGHLPGETILLDEAHHIGFTGDIYFNIKETTREQAAYNRYAPYLMTSVDTDPALAAKERTALFAMLSPGTWTLYGGHGPSKEITTPRK